MTFVYSIDSGQLIFTIRKIEEEFLKEYNYKIFEIFYPIKLETRSRFPRFIIVRFFSGAARQVEG